MKELIVVGGYTHRDHMMDEYEQQLIDAGVPYYFKQVEPMPNGPNSMTMRRKLAFMRDMSINFKDYNRIVFSDLFDVLFFGNLEEVAAKLPDVVMFSGERNCYPEPHLAPQFKAYSRWRYANAGMSCGDPNYVADWCDLVLKWNHELDMLDQQWLNRRAVEDHDCIFWIDEYTTVFYTVSSTQEDGALRMDNGRPFNSVTEQYPNFFHFSGRCHTTSFREMLVNGGQLG